MKNNVFLILFHNPWDWSADYANQTARRLSRNNYVICVLLGDARSVKEYLLESVKPVWWQTIHPRLYTCTPLHILPFRRFKVIERSNIALNIFLIRLWIYFSRRTHAIRRRFVWIFYPGHRELLPYLGRSFLVVYDCIDFFSGSTPHADRQLAFSEKMLIKSAAFFFVNSHALYARHQELRKGTIVPQGFRLDEARQFRKKTTIPIPHDKPVIGFLGGVNYRLDFRLLRVLVKNNPQWRFVFIGPIQTLDTAQFIKDVQSQVRALFRFPNCLYFPNQPKDTTFSILKHFDVCMIPYNTRLDFNRYSFPMKLFEYFYAGKPVVSTPIEELKRYKTHLRIGITAREWEGHIHHFLLHPLSSSYKTEQRMLAQQNSWEEKISSVLRFIGR